MHFWAVLFAYASMPPPPPPPPLPPLLLLLRRLCGAWAPVSRVGCTCQPWKISLWIEFYSGRVADEFFCRFGPSRSAPLNLRSPLPSTLPHSSVRFDLLIYRHAPASRWSVGSSVGSSFQWFVLTGGPGGGGTSCIKNDPLVEVLCNRLSEALGTGLQKR